MKKLILAVIMFFTMVNSSFAQHTVDAVDIFAHIEDSTVSIFMIGGGLGYCSGTVVEETKNQQFILTAKHCIDVDEEIYVENNLVKYTISSADDDLALLVIDNKIESKIPASLGYREGFIGDEVYHIGYPSGVKYMTKGLITRISKDWQYYDFKAIPGCSGGGVFNKYGQLVGVVWGGMRLPKDNYPIKSVGEPLKDIKRFLNEVLPRNKKCGVIF